MSATVIPFPENRRQKTDAERVQELLTDFVGWDCDFAFRFLVRTFEDADYIFSIRPIPDKPSFREFFGSLPVNRATAFLFYGADRRVTHVSFRYQDLSR